METALNSQYLTLLSALNRLENESSTIRDRPETVKFFCLQVIPFLAQNLQLLSLWKDLEADYEVLDSETKKYERNAIHETKKAFKQLEKDLKAYLPLSEEITRLLQRTRLIIIKDQFQEIVYPIFSIYENALGRLLQALLKAGFRDICTKHTEVIDLDEYIQKDPVDPERQVLLDNNGKIKKNFSPEEVKEWDKLHNPMCRRTNPEFVRISSPQIQFFTFCPSSIMAINAAKQTYWDQFRNPAVVWKYFNAALWYWNLPSSYFDVKLQVIKSQADALRFRRQTFEYSTWREISSAKNRPPSIDRAIIFTKVLFQQGLRTLINSITAFLAVGGNQTNGRRASTEEVIFELFWNFDRLWISIDSITFKNKFCIQKFNSGYKEGSEQRKFCFKLVDAAVKSKRFPCEIEMARVAHVLGRLNLPKILKSHYFGSTKNSSVVYQGFRLRLDMKISDLKNVVEELCCTHEANKSPILLL